MNKKIATRTGLITGTFIVGFLLLLSRFDTKAIHNLVLLQYAFIFLGMLASCFMLRKYYDGIKMFDYFKHCLRTLATAVVIIVIGNFIIYLLMRSNEEPWSNLTIVIGSILFATTLSGMFSSLIASFIFYTFTKKK